MAASFLTSKSITDIVKDRRDFPNVHQHSRKQLSVRNVLMYDEMFDDGFSFSDSVSDIGIPSACNAATASPLHQ